MSQATNRVNANRVHFTRLERAHVDFVRALSALPPPRIVGDADAADIEGRTDHVRAVYRACIHYIDAAVTDTMDHLAVVHVANPQAIQMTLFDAVSETDLDVIGDLQRAGVY